MHSHIGTEHLWLNEQSAYSTCANAFFSLRDKEKSKEEKEKAVEDDGEDTNCLFIWNIFSRWKKGEA